MTLAVTKQSYQKQSHQRSLGLAVLHRGSAAGIHCLPLGCKGAFSFNYPPPRDQYPPCHQSLEKDEGRAEAEGAMWSSEQMTVTWDAAMLGGKMGFIGRHK